MSIFRSIIERIRIFLRFKAEKNESCHCGCPDACSCNMQGDQKNLQQIINAVADPIFVKDEQHRWIELNDAFCSFIGQAREDLIGKSDYDFFPKQEADVFWKQDDRVFTSGKTNINTENFTDAKGKTHIISTKKEVFRGSDGKKILVGVIRDITDLMEAQEKAQKSEKDYTDLVNNLNIGIYCNTGGPKGKFLRANPAIVHMFGYDTEEEFMKISVADLYRDPAERKRFVEKIKKAGSVKNEVLALKKKDGTPVWGSVTARLAKDAQGNILWMDGAIEDVTEKVESEKQLHRLAAIVESTDDAIVGKTSEGIITDWNRGAERLYGYTSEEIVGKPVDIIIPEEIIEQHAQIMESVRKGECIQNHETVRRRKNGSLVSVALTISPVHDADGNIIGISAMGRDITEQKAIQEKLQESEARFRNLVEGIREDYFFYSHDTEGVFKYISPSITNTLGYQPDEFLQHYSAYLTDSPVNKEVDKHTNLSLQGKEQEPYPVEIYHKDGSVHWLEVKETPVWDALGKVVGVEGIAHDITERKKSQEQLEEASARIALEAENAKKFMKAVEASSIATVITTTDPEILYANPAWEKLTGYSEAEAKGKNPRILQSGKTPKEMYPVMWNAITKGREFMTDEIINKRKDGTEFNAELRVYPIIGEDGAVQFFVGMQTDITLRKRTEVAKSEFVSLASHQLRTPLTAIRWGIQMMRKKGTFNLTQEQIAEDIHNSTERMSETINTMLQLSRIEAGRVEPAHEKVDLCELLEEISANITPFMQEKAQKYTYNCAIDHQELVTDRTILKEILTNILSNSLKYTPEGGFITVDCKVLGDQLRISVIDTGYGIPKEQQEKVFTRFFRADNIIEKFPDGTGLGLFLVHSLVTLLSGSITFVSKENKGTTFTISLPLTPPKNAKENTNS